MPLDTNSSANASTNADVLNELNDDRLRRAVEQVRARSVPHDALSRALVRAEDLTSVIRTVRHDSTISKPTTRTIQKVASLVCLSWFLAALFWTLAESVQEARYAAQSKDHMHNYGIAMHGLAGHQPVEGVNDDSGTDKPSNPAKRVIHTADVSLAVEDLTKTESQLDELLRRFQAYVATSQVSELQGQQRTARWVIRVPVESLGPFLEAVAILGSRENHSTNTRDVTKEYFDLETRISSKQELEKRILGLLENHAGDIKDVIAVEEQLGRIREEIERMQGKVKSVDNTTALATVTVSAREEHEHISPQAPSFSTQIGRAWDASLNGMKRVGRSLVLVAVTAGPWLPFIGFVGFVILRALKRRRRRIGGSQ